MVADGNEGNIHLLVNCAVYFGSKGIIAEKKDWDKTFSVNVVGYILTWSRLVIHS